MPDPAAPVTAAVLARPAAGAALVSVSSAQEWNGLIAALPGAHILQSWEWGELKTIAGWHPRRLSASTSTGPAAAQVLARTAAGLARVLYVPKGPLLNWRSADARAQMLDTLEALARRERALLIKIDPDVALSSGPLGAESAQPTGHGLQVDLTRRGWVASSQQIQFRNTVTLDLRRSDDELLAAMHPKTRYNIRLAERKGVIVRAGQSGDLELLYRLYAETSLRDGFAIRSLDYYRQAWGSFMRAGLAQSFVAEVDGQPVAGLIVFRFGRTAWYMYGMSRATHRDKMPNHLLQWRAIRWAQAQGCEAYDFWGAPDAFDERDKLWGVWKFKEGFGGQVVRGLGAWDFAPSAPLYRLYTAVLPRLLDVMRRRGRRQTEAALGRDA